MEQNEFDLENEGSASKFERFLFLMIPIIFTLVLIGVLLTLFNMDIRNNVLQALNKIPVVEQWIPDPKTDSAGTSAGSQKTDSTKADETAKASDPTVKELKAQLAQQQEQVKKLTDEKTAQDQQMKALKTQITDLQNAGTAQAAAQADENYQKSVKDLAKLYAGMKAAKAAAIMQNLTTEEMVQLFSAMNNESKTAILEKMDPKIAADVSIKLKEATDSSDMAIAALQSRLKKESGTQASAGTASGATLGRDQLSTTFTSMPAEDSAKLLNQMYSVTPDKVITILKSVNDSTRSSILSQMTKDNAEVAGKVVNRLMGGK
ncbi:kinesin [Paenibacillus glufosinatiresistens]|uniref:kinesin n=1 Tax=Paenibacillus glufosinatiresistens TaxID=3070657 RepID=UPI00286DA272|nr:kinesin [Paenibacillus sp. YX.27]